MKPIIFRNPFVTKSDKMVAKTYMDVAKTLNEQVEKYGRNDDGTFNDFGLETALKAFGLMGKAAKKLGFRCYADMVRYKKRHGTI